MVLEFGNKILFLQLSTGSVVLVDLEELVVLVDLVDLEELVVLLKNF